MWRGRTKPALNRETRRLACFRGQNGNSGHIKAQADFRGELGTDVAAGEKRGGEGSVLQPFTLAC